MDWTEEILAAALTMTGELDAAQTALLRCLCRAAAQELLGSLRENASAELCRDAFVCAAACLAASRLLGASAEPDGGFTAGALSVGGGTGEAHAQSLRRTAAELMAPYCKAGDFAFLGVPV